MRFACPSFLARSFPACTWHFSSPFHLVSLFCLRTDFVGPRFLLAGYYFPNSELSKFISVYRAITAEHIKHNSSVSKRKKRERVQGHPPRLGRLFNTLSEWLFPRLLTHRPVDALCMQAWIAGSPKKAPQWTALLGTLRR